MKIIKCGAESGIVKQKANPLESHENREMFTQQKQRKICHDTVLNKINQVLNKMCGLLRIIDCGSLRTVAPAERGGPLRPIADVCEDFGSRL